jgi:hypothetical protein
MDAMAITRGFGADPGLELLEESAWELSIDLDEEHHLARTSLVSLGFGGWVTVVQPPWPFGAALDENATTWEIRQWREDEQGHEHDRAKRPISAEELVGVVPGRFGSWVLETTAEALSSLASIVDEADEMLGIDGAAALLGGVGRLRADLAKAEARHADLRARTRRVYGDVYLYDFPPEMDVEWRLGSLADGT